MVSPSEGDIVARRFYNLGYNVFVLVYTVNLLDTSLKLQPLHDISRAARMIRKNEEFYRIDPKKFVVCGFSAGGHLCASLCVHYKDISDTRSEYMGICNRPDAAVLSYPVINSGKYAHRESFIALLGEEASEMELKYMSLEKQVMRDTPPCFIWQTAPDETVSVENSYLFAKACMEAGVLFAHHVFSDGEHGMSILDEEWLEQRHWDPYTLEQIKLLGDAIKANRTSYPPELGQKILKEFGFSAPELEPQIPERKEALRRILPEVGAWTEMVGIWLDRILDLG